MSPDPARLVAWEALSDLFLDTDLTDQDIDFIVRRLKSTGFSTSELERIYEEEVAPVCWRNLTNLPGGIWMGFDRDWLVGAITSRLSMQDVRRRAGLLQRLRKKLWTAQSRRDWDRVKRELHH
jgi:hypothetical protein